MIITVTNSKGGTAKTVTTLNLGIQLSRRGYSVLIVDLDGQNNLSYTLQANTNNLTAMDVLADSSIVRESIQHVSEGVEIIAGSTTLFAVDKLLDEHFKEYRLKEALSFIKDKYQFILIDTPPALSTLTINALTASDGVIIPAQADTYSLQGIDQLSQTIETVRKYSNQNLKILGVVVTRFNARAIIRQTVVELLQNTVKKLSTQVYNTKIRECLAIVEANAKRQSIFSYSPKSNAAKDYANLTEEILKQIQEN